MKTLELTWYTCHMVTSTMWHGLILGILTTLRFSEAESLVRSDN